MPVELTYGLSSARLIDKLYYEDEFALGMVYGGFLGAGKSSYCIKTLAEVYGSHSGFPENVPNYEAVKGFIEYAPKGFVERLLKMQHREKVICFDDMGLWLFSLDWYDPFVKAVVKYMNVARTDWGMILGNTPSPKMVVNFVRSFPEIIRVKISKDQPNILQPSKPRTATAYRVWVTPDLKHTGVKKLFTDQYKAIMPDDFFKWYKPLRDSYAFKAKELMASTLEKLKKVDKEEVVENSFKNVLVVPERLKELEEVVKQLDAGEDRF